MERLHTRLRTWFPNARWPKLWRSPKGDMATASAGPVPVGYLVNHPGGFAGVQGIGYDYVLGSEGVYVQSRSAHLTARVPVAPGTVRGLAPVAEKLQLTHGPIPAHLFELGWAGSRTPRTPSGSSQCAGTGEPTGWWSPHRPAPPRDSPTSPRRAWSPSSTPTEAPAPSSRPPTTGTSRASASTGSSDASMPSGPSCGSGRGLRPLRPGGLVADVRRTAARTPAHGRGAGVNTRHKSNAKEVTRDALLLGQRIPARQPLDHRGRLRRDRRLRGRGPLPPLPGKGGHHRPGRP